MPRRLAITAPHIVEVIEYEDRPLQPTEVLVRTQLASGKHGTFTALMENTNFVGESFEQNMRLFVPSPETLPNLPTRANPWATGTSGVGIVEEVGAEVTRWKVGDRVLGLMDVRETNLVHQDRLWPLCDIDPEDALLIEPACRVACTCYPSGKGSMGHSFLQDTQKVQFLVLGQRANPIVQFCMKCDRVTAILRQSANITGGHIPGL